MSKEANLGPRWFRRVLPLALPMMIGLCTEPASGQATSGPAGGTIPRAAPRSGNSPDRPLPFEAMAQGQSPGRLFITCSDSRLVPSWMTWTGAGELFVIRNAGNIVPPFDPRPEGATATIEYAVAVLEVPTIVVCGHTFCGAMKAALEPAGLETVPNIRNWIKFVEPARLAVEELHPHLDGDSQWEKLVEQNVYQQIANLKTHPWVAARTASGRLRLEGWIYDLTTRKIRELTLP